MALQYYLKPVIMRSCWPHKDLPTSICWVLGLRRCVPLCLLKLLPTLLLDFCGVCLFVCFGSCLYWPWALCAGKHSTTRITLANFHHVLRQSLTEHGIYPFSEAGWPGSFKNPTVFSCPLVRGIEACMAMPGFWCGCWGSELVLMLGRKALYWPSHLPHSLINF